MKPVFWAIYIGGGVILALAPFERKRTRTEWARAALLLTAVLLAFVGTAELLRYYRLWVLSPQMEHGFSYTLAVLRGVVVGFLLSLAFSGELGGRKVSLADRPNQALEPTASRSDV
jgi:hypothetical protein